MTIPPATRVTEVTGWQTRLGEEGLAVNVTKPAKVPIDCTVTTDDPDCVARTLAGETRPRETVKVLVLTITPAAPLTALDSVEAAAAVPVTVTVKEADGRGLQVTDIRPAALTLAAQPVG